MVRKDLELHCSEEDFVMFRRNYYLLWDKLKSEFPESQLRMTEYVNLTADNSDLRPHLYLRTIEARALQRIAEFRMM